MTRPRGGVTVAVMSVDLHWIPLGAGGHVVAFNGRVFEALAAGRAHRPRRALYHAALVVETAGVRFAIELAPETDDAVATGPVGARWAGRVRLFRYGLRCAPGGTIPDLAYAVGGPVRVSTDPAVAARIVALAPRVPRLTWGRDEARAGTPRLGGGRGSRRVGHRAVEDRRRGRGVVVRRRGRRGRGVVLVHGLSFSLHAPIQHPVPVRTL